MVNMSWPGRHLGPRIQNWEIPETQDRDREANQEAGEEEGGSRGDLQPGEEQEEEDWAGWGETEEHQQGPHHGEDEVDVCDRLVQFIPIFSL